jgi:hypothetical protein
MAMQVSAALVVATTENGRVIHLYKGDTVPKDVTKDSLDNLRSLGFVSGDEVDPAPVALGEDEPEKPARRTAK